MPDNGVTMSDSAEAVDIPNEYVAGFMFDPGLTTVMLIEKKRPKWQAGRLNGVGGHMKVGETPEQAMRREAIEEAGTDQQWTRYATLGGDGFTVHFHFAVGPIWEGSTQTDEEIWCPLVSRLPENVMPNLTWLIPMALTVIRKQDRCSVFGVTERA